MTDLNQRKVALLKAIVEEYVKTAEPVGSKNLVRRYKLKISPATVRNEMAVLVEEGFLSQPHSSAGRIPAPMGIRYYIQQLMEERNIPVIEEVAIKQRLEADKNDIAKLLRAASYALAEKTNLASVMVTEDGLIFSSGLVNLLDHPEFFDIDVTRAVLFALDNHDILMEIFSRKGEEDISVLLGEEMELANFDEIGIIFTAFKLGDRKCFGGVLGPCRMDFSTVIPFVRHFGKVMEDTYNG